MITSRSFEIRYRELHFSLQQLIKKLIQDLVFSCQVIALQTNTLVIRLCCFKRLISSQVITFCFKIENYQTNISAKIIICSFLILYLSYVLILILDQYDDLSNKKLIQIKKNDLV